MNVYGVTRTAYKKADLFVDCPACCGEDFRVDHLAEGQSMLLHCDACGGTFKIQRLTGDAFRLQQTDRAEVVIVTLQSDGPVRLMIEGRMNLIGQRRRVEDELAHQKYHYNEHTCPTNYIGDVLKVVDPADGDQDPHGIFKFVSQCEVIKVAKIPEVCPKCGMGLSEETVMLWSCTSRGCADQWFMVDPMLEELSRTEENA